MWIAISKLDDNDDNRAPAIEPCSRNIRIFAQWPLETGPHYYVTSSSSCSFYLFVFFAIYVFHLSLRVQLIARYQYRSTENSSIESRVPYWNPLERTPHTVCVVFQLTVHRCSVALHLRWFTFFLIPWFFAYDIIDFNWTTTRKSKPNKLGQQKTRSGKENTRMINALISIDMYRYVCCVLNKYTAML